MQKVIYVRTTVKLTYPIWGQFQTLTQPSCHKYIGEPNPRTHSPLPRLHSRQARAPLPFVLWSFYNPPPLFPSPHISLEGMDASSCLGALPRPRSAAANGWARAATGEACERGRRQARVATGSGYESERRKAWDARARPASTATDHGASSQDHGASYREETWYSLVRSGFLMFVSLWYGCVWREMQRVMVNSDLFFLLYFCSWSIGW